MSTTTIRYEVVSDCCHNWDTWTGDRDEAIEAGRAAIGARMVAYSSDYHYRADETGSYYLVTADELARLGAALLAGHTIGEAYSIWCSSSGREVHARD